MKRKVRAVIAKKKTDAPAGERKESVGPAGVRKGMLSTLTPFCLSLDRLTALLGESGWQVEAVRREVEDGLDVAIRVRKTPVFAAGETDRASDTEERFPPDEADDARDNEARFLSDDRDG